jgi:hypothetical protein
LQQAAGGGLETSKGLLLQPIGDGVKQKRRLIRAGGAVC